MGSEIQLGVAPAGLGGLVLDPDLSTWGGNRCDSPSTEVEDKNDDEDDDDSGGTNTALNTNGALG